LLASSSRFLAYPPGNYRLCQQSMHACRVTQNQSDRKMEIEIGGIYE
jgi:hypothetical protein